VESHVDTVLPQAPISRQLRSSAPRLVAQGRQPPVFAESGDPARLVPIVTEPIRITIAVAGDPARANAYVFSHDGPHGGVTAKPIRFVPLGERNDGCP